jgi:hypothetical protein
MDARSAAVVQFRRIGFASISENIQPMARGLRISDPRTCNRQVEKE